MTLFDAAPVRSAVLRVPTEHLDFALTAQIAVAWAGERGEEPRLGWWNSDYASLDGGFDLFGRLMSRSMLWTSYQAARETARRVDAEMRRRDSNPDRVISLYSLGFELDEKLEDRLRDLRRTGLEPHQCLSALADIRMEWPWDRGRFAAWLSGQGTADISTTPVGRRLSLEPTASLDTLIRALLAGLLPLGDTYPLPHVRRAV